MLKTYIQYYEKGLYQSKFHNINHKPFKNTPYVYYTIRTQYAARSPDAASLGICCQFVKIYHVIHNPLHIHRFLVDE